MTVPLSVVVASTIFADVRLIGRSVADASAIAFETAAYPRSCHLLVDKIRSVGLGRHLPPDPDAAIDALMTRTKFDLGNLALEVAAADERDSTGSGCWFPRSRRYMTSQQDGERRLADAHLHSGAAIDLDGLCRLLAGSHRAMELEVGLADEFADPLGRRVSFLALAVAIRDHLQYLGDGDLARAALRSCAQAIADGNYWRGRAEAIGLDAHGGARIEIAQAADDGGNEGGSDPTRASSELARILTAGITTADELSLIVALTLLNSQLTSRHQEGLNRFVDRFQQMGFMRDSMLGGVRSGIVAESCAAVFTSEMVEAAEFRKTIHIGRRTSAAASKLRRSLRDHVEGFRDFAKESGRRIRVSMPVTFSREPTNSAPQNDEIVSLHRLTGIWYLAAEIAHLFDESNIARELITSVDVVGPEIRSANWPYLMAFELLAEHVGADGLQFSMHAGESYRWPMEGVRSVGELLLPRIGVDRIGHALALSHSAPTYPALAAAPTPRDIVEDLCFLYHLGLSQGEVVQRLEEVLRLPFNSSARASAAELVDAWLLRRSVDELRGLGVLGSDAFASTGWPSEHRPIREFRWASSPERAAMLLIYRVPGVEATFDAPAPGSLGSDHILWSAHLLPEARTLVRERIRDAQIVIESCPSSNLTLSGFGSGSELPIGEFIDDGIRVSLNSDDPLLFGTCIVSEAALVEEVFGQRVADSAASTSLEACCSSAIERGFGEFVDLSRLP